MALGKKTTVEIGNACQRIKMRESRKNGNIVVPWTQGADFLEIDRKGRMTFKEVKKDCSIPLSKFQRRFKAKVEKLGFGYEKESCVCSR